MSDYDDINFGETLRGLRAGMRVFGGRYELIRKLGRGGMGEVWLASDSELEEKVALKFLPEIARQDPGALDDLRRETRKSRRLSHPHIVRVHDFLVDDVFAAISMEYIQGKTLTELRLKQPGKVFECDDLKPIVDQLCEALDYAHKRARIVHRDLKPANVMITEDGQVKVADFGISASITDTVSRTSVQASSSGTPVYMSPQQMMGDKPSEADDIYSLGALLYELLTGKPPFYTGNVIVQVQSKDPPSITDRREELEVSGEPIPDNWNQLLSACLNKSPKERPKKASEVVNFLKKDVQPGLGQAICSDPQVAMISCPQCEEKIPESAKFCNHCGAQIQELVKEPIKSEETQTSSPVHQEMPLVQKEAEEELKPNKIQGTPIKLPVRNREVEAAELATPIEKHTSNLYKDNVGYWVASTIIGIVFGFFAYRLYLPFFITMIGQVAVVLAFSIYTQTKTRSPLLVLLLNLIIVGLFVLIGSIRGNVLEYLLPSAGIMYVACLLTVGIGAIMTSRKYGEAKNESEKVLEQSPKPELEISLLNVPTIVLFAIHVLVCVWIGYSYDSGDVEKFSIVYFVVMSVFLVFYALYLERLLHIALSVIIFYIPLVITIHVQEDLRGEDFMNISVCATIVILLGWLAAFLKRVILKKRHEAREAELN